MGQAESSLLFDASNVENLCEREMSILKNAVNLLLPSLGIIICTGIARSYRGKLEADHRSTVRSPFIILVVPSVKTASSTQT